jgi:hypothetical protein
VRDALRLRRERSKPSRTRVLVARAAAIQVSSFSRWRASRSASQGAM